MLQITWRSCYNADSDSIGCTRNSGLWTTHWAVKCLRKERQKMTLTEFMLYIRHCTRLFEYINLMVSTYIFRLGTARWSEDVFNYTNSLEVGLLEILIQRSWSEREKSIFFFWKALKWFQHSIVIRILRVTFNDPYFCVISPLEWGWNLWIWGGHCPEYVTLYGIRRLYGESNLTTQAL